MDRLESMAVFVDVVQAGSLVAAAERRGLSPSMVGKHLRALEERVGLRLLQRTTRRQKLTEAGNSSSNAAGGAAAGRGGGGGYRIAAGRRRRPAAHLGADLLWRDPLSPALAAFRQTHPRIEVELMLSDAPVDVIGDGVDVAFLLGPLAESGLIARPLEQFYRMIVCAAPDYLAFGRAAGAAGFGRP
jgi:DNA-binding transcriptional LysR family regulator